MNKVPSPRNLLPKKLRRAVVFCAVMAAGASVLTVIVNAAAQMRLSAFLGQAQRALPKIEEAAELYIKANKAPAPSREKKMVFPHAKKAESQG